MFAVPYWLLGETWWWLIIWDGGGFGVTKSLPSFKRYAPVKTNINNRNATIPNGETRETKATPINKFLWVVMRIIKSFFFSMFLLRAGEKSTAAWELSELLGTVKQSKSFLLKNIHVQSPSSHSRIFPRSSSTRCINLWTQVEHCHH